MFQINEKHVFLSAIASATIIFSIKSLNLEVLSDLQAIIGIYLLLIPVGYLFLSILMPLSKINLSERFLLSIVLSVSINTLVILVLFFIFKVPLNFLNNLLTVTVISILFYGLYFFELVSHFRIKPPEMKI